MERYLGLDVHAASCTLAVISEKGRKLRDFPVETNGQALGRGGPDDPQATSTWCSKRDSRAPGCTRRSSAHVAGDRSRGGHAEPSGSEERQARCLWPGREAPGWEPRQVRSSSRLVSLRSAARSLADSHHAGWRCPAGSGPDQELVSRLTHSVAALGKSLLPRVHAASWCLA